MHKYLLFLNLKKNFYIRKRLFAGTVPANKNLFAGTAPANKNLFAGTLPANKNLFAGTSSGKLELICRNLFRQIRAYLPEPLR